MDQGELTLNGVKYKTIGPVKSALSSIYPPKQVSGDYTRDSQQYASVVAWSDYRGGIGLNRQRVADDAFSRCWWSTCQLGYHEHLVLPPLATVTAASGVAGVFSIGAIGELSSEIYAAFGSTVKKYTHSTDSWATSTTLSGTATHVLTFRMNGTVYLAFATGNDYTYSSDGSSWATSTKNVQFLAWWDDRLWGIDSTGQLWFSTSIGVETDDAQIPLPSDSVTNLYVGNLLSGNSDPVLYVATTSGLYVHDIENRQFRKTTIPSGLHPDSGKGSLMWRDAHFFSSGNGMVRYGQSPTGASISVMGPDRDDGLPSDKRGSIRQILDSVNEMLALVDGTNLPAITTLSNYAPETALNAADVVSPDVGYSHILGWNGQGWQVKWLSTGATLGISSGHVSFAYSKYRLWWAHNQRVYYMSLPRDVVNPSEITTFAYAASADHELTWFNADQVEVDKLALELRIETFNCSATETVAVSYGVDYSTTYTSLGTISTTGITTYYFPSGTDASAANTGTAFRAMRFKVSLARGGTTTLSPDVVSITLSYRKKLPAKYIHTVDLNLMGHYDGRSPKEQRAALVSAIASSAKVEMTFRNDSGLSRNLYVDVIQATGLESTGEDERGTSTVTMVVP